MPELLVVLGVLAILGIGWLLLTTDPKVLARLLRYGFVGALAILGLFLATRGLAVLDLPLGAFALILLRGWSARGFSGAKRLRDWLSGAPRDAGQSTVETGWLRMALDRSSGALSGEVLAGRFAGARLDQLGLDELRALLAECEAADPQTARLVETYLDRTHPGWRDRPGGNDERERSAGAAGGGMTQAEAWQVLGLEPGADADQIHEAHRRLMMQLHPDRGGSNYLASKINMARDVLLRQA
jgi:hypothetical protein